MRNDEGGAHAAGGGPSLGIRPSGIPYSFTHSLITHCLDTAPPSAYPPRTSEAARTPQMKGTPIAPRGFGLRQSPGALGAGAARRKRQRTGAVQKLPHFSRRLPGGVFPPFAAPASPGFALECSSFAPRLAVQRWKAARLRCARVASAGSLLAGQKSARPAPDGSSSDKRAGFQRWTPPRRTNALPSSAGRLLV